MNHEKGIHTTLNFFMLILELGIKIISKKDY